MHDRFIVFSGKVKILSISMRIIKKLWKTTLLSTHPFLQKIINSDASLVFQIILAVILRLINELTKIVAKISLFLVLAPKLLKRPFFMIYLNFGVLRLSCFLLFVMHKQ
jgi:hypothetical protein